MRDAPPSSSPSSARPAPPAPCERSRGPSRAPLVVAASLASALFVAGACSAGFFPSPITPSVPEPSATGPRAPFLPLARLRWTRGAEQAVLLTERGELVSYGVFLGTARPDGTFTTRDRSRTLVLSPDGTVHLGPGRHVQIAPDGAATFRVHGEPDETITLEEIAKPRPGVPGLVLEGGAPELRRTSMWILLIPDLLRDAPGAAD